MENKDKCCTPKGQVPRYVDCIGCDKKPIEIMSKQTAVEWYIEQRDMLESVSIEEYWERKNSINEQAKAMCKEEMIQFAIKCMFNSDDISSNLKNYFIQKYNETFVGDSH